jgi:hypothetical protein
MEDVKLFVYKKEPQINCENPCSTSFLISVSNCAADRTELSLAPSHAIRVRTASERMADRRRDIRS